MGDKLEPKPSDALPAAPGSLKSVDAKTADRLVLDSTSRGAASKLDPAVAAAKIAAGLAKYGGGKMDAVDPKKREENKAKVEASPLFAALRQQEGAAPKAAQTPNLADALAKLKASAVPAQEPGVTQADRRRLDAPSGEVIGIASTTGIVRDSSARQEAGRDSDARVAAVEKASGTGKTAPALTPQMASLEARITPEAKMAAQESARTASVDTPYFDKAKDGLKVLGKLTLGGPLETADDGLIFRQLVIAAGGNFETFKKDYVKANPKTGAQVEKFQRDWAKTNCGREDIYADIARMKSDLHAETRIAIGDKTRQPAGPLVRLGYEVAQSLGLGAKSLSGEEVAKVYGIAFMPAAAKEFVFNPTTKEIRAVGVGPDGNARLLASFNLPNDTDTQRKEYLAQLIKGNGGTPAASPKLEPAKKVEVAAAVVPDAKVAAKKEVPKKPGPLEAFKGVLGVDNPAIGRDIDAAVKEAANAAVPAATTEVNRKEAPKLVDHSKDMTPEEQARVQRTGRTG